MQTNGTGYLRQPFKLIREADPQLFKTMQATYWPVLTAGWEELATRLMRAGMAPQEALKQGLSYGQTALGLTLLPMDGRTEPSDDLDFATFMNREHVSEMVEAFGMNEVNLVAATLVHEFVHRQGESNEDPAYSAGSAFAMKIDDLQVYMASEMGRHQAAAMGLMEGTVI